MKVAILGYGLEGQAAYEYWNEADNQLTICDQNETAELPTDVQQRLGADYLKNLEHFDLIIRSPSVHPRDIVAANSSKVLQKITTVTNEFFEACPTLNILGITGTKGKGTTSTLITKMLQAAGKTAHLAGNIGTPVLELLKTQLGPSDFIVLELSNFQLIDLKYSPHTAVCLMVVPEHLDWHSDIDEYITAKQQLFRWQQPKDTALYYADNEYSTKVISVSSGRKIPYMRAPGAYVRGEAIVIDDQTICKTTELKLLGRHNWQNACAAVTAVWDITQNIKAIRSVLTTFTGLEHRLEFIREVDGIPFYNDSFAATPDAAIAALEAIPGPKVVIMGGFDRQLPLEHLGQAVAQHAPDIQKVVLIGASAERAAAVLTHAGYTNYVVSTEKSMVTIVGQAQAHAKAGDAIVLSPGFASFDMFKNFEDRGNQYKQAVQAL